MLAHHSAMGLLLTAGATLRPLGPSTASPPLRRASFHAARSSERFTRRGLGLGWQGVRVVVSVDWEGSGFEAENLAAFREFRDDFPNVPLTHFLNAAYFTRLAPDDIVGAASASDKIRTVLRDGDEIGLHVHADNHLLHAAGVAPRKFPSWDNLPDITGHSVPLSTFSEDEVRQIVHFSCRTLVQQGFDRPRAFRAGGWHAGGNVLNALAAEGFAVDSSEVPQDWLPSGFGDVERLWPNATRVSQPYRFQGGLVEVPDNGCLADYVTSTQMVDTFQAVARSAQQRPVVLSLGFHQETAAKFLPRLRSALLEIELRSAMQRIPLRYERARDIASAPWLPRAERPTQNAPSDAAAEAAALSVESARAAEKAARAAWLCKSSTSTPGSAADAPSAAASRKSLSPEENAKAAWLRKVETPTSSQRTALVEEES